MKDEWFKSRPVCVFIDNSALVATSFNISNPSFETLSKAIADGDLQLLVTEISKGEFIRHAEASIRKDHEALHKLGASHSLFRNDLLRVYESVKEASGAQVWDAFIQKFNPTDISCDVSWKQIFDDYFALRPPFNAKKKDEFPDAFNIRMLEAFNPKSLLVVSADGDFSQWSVSRDRTQQFRTVNELADAYLSIRDRVFTQKAIQAFNSTKIAITSRLSDYFSDPSNFSVICYHSEIESANIVELNVSSSDLVASDHDQNFAVFGVQLKGSAELGLHCPVVSWDSIDKEDVLIGHNARAAKVPLMIKATVTVFVDGDVLKEADFEIDDEEITAPDFEVPDSWTRFPDTDLDDER